jgi:two-component system nitrate/nitrite response regulator NarL
MRLILADDHNLFREALCYYLRQSWAEMEIIEAGNLDEALAAAEQNDPDALLIDLVMPGMDGVRGIEVARHRFPETPIIVLSGNISREDATAAMRNGAVGVISKDLTGEALMDALRRILAGEKLVASLPWQGSALAAPAAAGRAAAWRSFNLSAREVEAIRLLVIGLRDKAIAHELGIASITVRLHLHHAFAKMGARNRLDAVRIAMQSGLADP